MPNIMLVAKSQPGRGRMWGFLHDNILQHGDSRPSQSSETSWGGTDGDRNSVPGPSTMGHRYALRAGSKAQWEACSFSVINYLFHLSVLQLVRLQKRGKDLSPKCCRVRYLKEVHEDSPFISLCHARETLLVLSKIVSALKLTWPCKA